jgi:glycosyltransferase involved in cell wall biosynthesis
MRPETRLKILFVHQNAPGQFKHLAPHLAADPANEVVFLGQQRPREAGRVRWLVYPPPRPPVAETHRYLHRMEASVGRGQAVVRACLELREAGFVPDVVVGHPGWGETMFLREAFPRCRILSYCEMFYRSEGQDVGYLPELALDLDGHCRLRVWNADLLAGLDIMDRGLSPTGWQRAQHPAVYQPRIAVVHEGVDTAEMRPDPAARFRLPGGRVLSTADEVVTFVARNLEPVRGFTVLMRALPELLRRRPQAVVVICGEDGVSYGAKPDGEASWRAALLREVPLDPARVHFVDRLERAAYLRLLQVSALHLYLTVPFVLSWSMVEALAAGCLVLGAAVAPVREVVEDGVNGFLVDGRNPDAVARRAAELVAHRAVLEPVRQRARSAAVGRFDLRRCLAAQSALVREVAG